MIHFIEKLKKSKQATTSWTLEKKVQVEQELVSLE